MELKHLQALLGIADTGSFSAAATSIGTVQSNVSAHVARLERELDVQLVDRASGRLTEEGEVVVARARQVMNELEAMVSDVTALREEVIGTVRLGMIGTTGRWLVPQLFDLLRVRHPHIHLNVAEGSSVQLEQQLASGQLDLAVVTFPLSGDEIMAAQLFDEDLVAVLPAGTPPRRGILDPPGAALGRGAPPAGTGHCAQGGDRQRHGPGPHRAAPAMELDGVRLIASLAFDGYGPAILPATAVPGHLRGRFSVLPVTGSPADGWAWRSGAAGCPRRRHGR